VKSSQFTVDLLAWYAQHARVLPWRGDNHPYAVWVSEVMLQQTRVETVIPYFERWMRRFPDLAVLAQASQHDVLSAWEGLGYYNRARNLHRAAQIVLQEMNGELPRDPQALARLPGVGRYTAGAIASLAFGVDAPALDGNIRRVLARVFNLVEPARSPAGERRLWKLAAEHLPPGQAGDYNQALMDLGATVCTPRLPNCPECPLSRFCQARALGIQDERPVILKKAAIPHYIVTAAVICRDRQVLITQRPLDGLLGGLWEFPGGKLQPGEDLADCLQREISEELGVAVNVRGRMGIYRHAYTHFLVTLHAFRCLC
jgi:A/G-specific adenine glycosylase